MIRTFVLPLLIALALVLALSWVQATRPRATPPPTVLEQYRDGTTVVDPDPTVRRT